MIKTNISLLLILAFTLSFCGDQSRSYSLNSSQLDLSADINPETGLVDVNLGRPIDPDDDGLDVKDPVTDPQNPYDPDTSLCPTPSTTGICMVVKAFGVSSATITINRKTIVSPAMFNNTDQELAVEVELAQGNNEFVISLVGSPGDKLWVGFFNTKTTPMELVKAVEVVRIAGAPNTNEGSL